MKALETLPPAGFAPGVTMLVATGVEKTFDRTRALNGANLELRSGEVHGLLGANGAGKSTLSKIISGHVLPDAGAILYHGRPLRLRSTRDALAAGIAIVMQETSLVPDLTVAENIFLPELARPGRLSYADLHARGRDLLASLGQQDTLPIDIEVRRLSAAQKQLVEIAKALGLDARLIVFDEPTASLSPTEVDRLFDIMTRLRDRGSGLIFVSHRLEEVLEITDRVTIMREGRTVLASSPTASLGQSDLIRHMVGQDLGSIYTRTAVGPRKAAPVALSVSGLRSSPAVRDISFEVREGEILGLGGLVGAGRSEAVEAVFGLRAREAGTIAVGGKPARIRSPKDAMRAGLGFVAEDRRTQNIVPDLSVKENLLLAHLGARRGFGLGYRSRERQVDTLMASLGLPANRLLDASMLNFSGGMQQKIIIARWLLLEPKVLMLDEPTKGVDIATRSSIYEILRAVAAKGVAVVVVSSDFEELLGLSDRVVVISDGLSIADVPADLLDEEKLTLLAAPRTSMTRNTEVLQALAAETGGTGFWVLLDGDRLICLNLARSPQDGVDLGFVPGDAKPVGETRIPDALRRREAEFTRDENGARSTMLSALRTSRGHDLGWIGLTVDGNGSLPDPASVRRRIDALAQTL
jgi:ABC-type sugar transport system ATPase subunit